MIFKETKPRGNENCFSYWLYLCVVEMSSKKFLSLLQEEKLTEKLRNYPILYDKSLKGYKERDAVTNAWKEIADALDFVDNGKKLFFLINKVL